jgi:hypothetical protein
MMNTQDWDKPFVATGTGSGVLEAESENVEENDEGRQSNGKGGAAIVAGTEVGE